MEDTQGTITKEEGAEEPTQPKEEPTEMGEYIVPIHRAKIETILRLGPDEPLPRKREEYLDEIAEARAQEGGVLYWWRSKEKALSVVVPRIGE